MALKQALRSRIGAQDECGGRALTAGGSDCVFAEQPALKKSNYERRPRHSSPRSLQEFGSLIKDSRTLRPPKGPAQAHPQRQWLNKTTHLAEPRRGAEAGSQCISPNFPSTYYVPVPDSGDIKMSKSQCPPPRSSPPRPGARTGSALQIAHLRKKPNWNSRHGASETNLTRNDELAGSIPGLAGSRMGLRIQRCRELWCGSQTRLGSSVAVAVV